MQIKTAKLLNMFAVIVMGAAGFYVCIRWLLPWLLPLLLALLCAAAIEPAVGFLCRRGLKRALAAGICVLLTLAMLFGAMWLLLTYAADTLRDLTERLPEWLNSVSETLELWEGMLFRLGDRVPPELDVWLEQSAEALRGKLRELPGVISAKVLSRLSGAAAEAPGTLLFAVTALIGFYFASASYPELRIRIGTLLPVRMREQARQMRENLGRTMGRWLKAQLILLLITFTALTAAFWLLHIEYALLLAFTIAVIDALPILGTGTVLLPWALYELLTGQTRRAIGLAVTYAAVTVLRNCVQPKLLGDQLGLHPLAALASIYVGWKAWGVMGMLTFPILAITGKQLLDSVVLRREAFRRYEGE